MSGAVPLSVADLAVACALILVSGTVSLALGLRMEKQLALAAVRTVVQLLLVGQILKVVFDLDAPLPVLGVLGLMIAASGRAAVARPSRTFGGAYLRAFSTLALTGLLTTFTVTGLIIGVEPWFRPQYLIPLLGMVLGNTLTGISLCLDHLLETLDVQRDTVEMELALGATAWEAARAPVSTAVQKGMIPIVNAMMVVGIVSLPGMMTGQILAGADPLEAVKYQIVVMFMLAAGTALGSVAMAYLTFRRLFDPRHRLRSEDIRKR